jgi:hypothetical protein
MKVLIDGELYIPHSLLGDQIVENNRIRNKLDAQAEAFENAAKELIEFAKEFSGYDALRHWDKNRPMKGDRLV